MGFVYQTGVIYELGATEAHDGIHVETCGPDYYLIQVKTHGRGSGLVTIPRTDVKNLIHALQEHIESMEALELAEEEEE